MSHHFALEGAVHFYDQLKFCPDGRKDPEVLRGPLAGITADLLHLNTNRPAPAAVNPKNTVNHSDPLPATDRLRTYRLAPDCLHKTDRFAVQVPVGLAQDRICMGHDPAERGAIV